MQGFAGDDGVFIRSMASRGAMGGVTRAAADVCAVMEAAGRQTILIETVGVGQDEVDVIGLADVTVLVLVPGMGDEVQRLKDRVKQQEGATARVQEMLQGLEGRLSQPESAYAALVFYQLRELWSLGARLLTQFATELAQQQEERERRAFLAEFNRRQFDRRQGIDANLREAEARAEEARAAVSEIEQGMARLQRFWHYFKRRALRQRLQTANLQSMLCAQELDAGSMCRNRIAGEDACDFAVLGEGHVEHEVVPGHARDFQ